MQQQAPSTGTWRIGFDLAAFVMLATIAGMAAAVTLASIALLLTSVVPNAPAAAPAAPVSAPAAPVPLQPAPAPEPVVPETPSRAPTVHTQLARMAAPAHCTAAASAGRGASFLPGRPPRSPASAQKFA